MCRSLGGQGRVLVRGRSGGATAVLVGRRAGKYAAASSYVQEGRDGSQCRDGCLRYIRKRIGGPLSSVGWVRLLTWVDRHVPWERERESMSAGSARPGAYGGVSRCDGQMWPLRTARGRYSGWPDSIWSWADQDGAVRVNLSQHGPIKKRSGIRAARRGWRHLWCRTRLATRGDGWIWRCVFSRGDVNRVRANGVTALMLLGCIFAVWISIEQIVGASRRRGHRVVRWSPGVRCVPCRRATNTLLRSPDIACRPLSARRSR